MGQRWLVTFILLLHSTESLWRITAHSGTAFSSCPYIMTRMRTEVLHVMPPAKRVKKQSIGWNKKPLEPWKMMELNVRRSIGPYMTAWRTVFQNSRRFIFHCYLCKKYYKSQHNCSTESLGLFVKAPKITAFNKIDYFLMWMACWICLIMHDNRSCIWIM